MILDKELLFSDAQAIATTAGSEASTNVVDFGAGTGRNMNPRLRVFAQVVQAPAGLTSLQVKLQGSANNSDWVDIVSSGAVALASLVKGAQLFKSVPYLVDEKYRYYRLYYTQVGNSSTAAKVTGGFITDGVPVVELTH